MTQIFTPTKALKLKGEFAIDWKVLQGKASGELLAVEYLPVVVGEINRTLLTAIMKAANPDRNYFVCFDELDLGFSLESSEYEAQITGLLLAARRINNHARNAGKSVSIVIFLRDDIYNMLHFEDKNKITQSAVSIIQWDVGKEGSSLKSLMEKRFHITLGIPEEGAWESVFDETKEMSGHQTKYKHIVDRTFLRPRDIIKFVNEVLAAHRRGNTTENEKFSNYDLHQARTVYSEYLLDELDDEIKKHISEYKRYMEVLKSLGSLQFTFEELERTCGQRKDLLPAGTSPGDMLSQLYEFSVIGYYKPGGRGLGGSDYIWKHKDRRALFNENAQSFRIHPGLMEVLGVKKFTWSA